MNAKNRLRIALDEVGSTNDYAKDKRSEGRELVVTAKRQIGGRGTKGRAFSSNEGGVYLSLLNYPNSPAKDAYQITLGAAVAVCKTLEEYGVKPVIKWVNDVFVNGKKIAGILVENALSGGLVSSSVVGVGLNVNNVLPAELLEIATTLEKAGGTASVEEVTEKLLAHLEEEFSMEEYRRRLGFVGERVTLIKEEKSVSATLLGVTDLGELQVEIEGETVLAAFGEVSLRV